MRVEEPVGALVDAVLLSVAQLGSHFLYAFREAVSEDLALQFLHLEDLHLHQRLLLLRSRSCAAALRPAKIHNL